jgi:hypothetical protein
MDKRNLIVPLLLAGAIWLVASPLAAQDDGLFWFNNYDDAIQEAKRTGKPIFLEYRCEP